MYETQQLCLNFDVAFVSLEGISSSGSFASGWAVVAPMGGDGSVLSRYQY